MSFVLFFYIGSLFLFTNAKFIKLFYIHTVFLHNPLIFYTFVLIFKEQSL